MPCSRTQHGLTQVGLEPQTSGSGVRGINHQATALPHWQLTLAGARFQNCNFVVSYNTVFNIDYIGEVCSKSLYVKE